MAGGKVRAENSDLLDSWPQCCLPPLTGMLLWLGYTITLTTSSVKASVHLISPLHLCVGSSPGWQGLGQGLRMEHSVSEWVWTAVPANSSAANIILLMVKSNPWGQGHPLCHTELQRSSIPWIRNVSKQVQPCTQAEPCSSSLRRHKEACPWTVSLGNVRWLNNLPVAHWLRTAKVCATG